MAVKKKAATSRRTKQRGQNETVSIGFKLDLNDEDPLTAQAAQFLRDGYSPDPVLEKMKNKTLAIYAVKTLYLQIKEKEEEKKQIQLEKERGREREREIKRNSKHLDIGSINSLG